MSKHSKKYLIPSLAIFILLSFTSIAFARGNRNTKWTRKTPTPRPIITSSPKPSASPTLLPTASPSATPTAQPTVKPSVTPTATPANTLSVFVTYYGWPDNDPAGNAIAYPKSDGYPSIHEGAGGTGTFENPVTFAAKIGRFPVGTKLYVPYIKKYVILEDTCASCTANWIDIWMESDGNYQSKVIACEEYWTKENMIVEVNPPAGREVVTTPLFNKTTGVCQN